MAPQTALGPEHPPEPAEQQGLPIVPHAPPLHEPAAQVFEPNVQLPPGATHSPSHGSQQPPLSHLAPGQHCCPGAPHAKHVRSQRVFGLVHCLVPQQVWLVPPHVPQLPFVQVPPKEQRAPEPVHRPPTQQPPPLQTLPSQQACPGSPQAPMTPSEQTMPAPIVCPDS